MNYFTGENYEIESIIVDNYSFCPIIPQVNYLSLWHYNRNIPPESKCREEQYWLCEHPTNIIIYLKSGLILRYKIKNGYYTDFASVPNFVKSIIDADDRAIIIPAIIHDINFGTHLISFEDSNKLFLEMMKYYKMHWIKQNLCYTGVSWFGGSRYKKSVEDIHREKSFINFDWDKSNEK